MRSLKIIIFRDTDKPYTMILSPRILVGTSFALVALFSLLSFSVMSNVMFVTRANSVEPDSNTVQGVFADNGSSEESKPYSDNEAIAEENGTEDQQPTADPSEETPAVNENGETQEQPAIAEDDSEAVKVEDNEAETSLINSTLAPVNLGTSDVEVALLNNPTLGSNSISMKVQVRKRLNRGESSRGRLVVVLLDNYGNLGKAFPLSVFTEGTEVMNPEKGDSFRIRYSRDYSVRFDNIKPDDFSSVVLMIFDQEGQTLLWRNVLPVSK